MPSPSKARIWVRRLGAGLAILAVIGLGASFPVTSSYASRAVLAQRVEVDKAAESLFGGDDAYRPIGSPQKLIIDDPKAFLPDAPDHTKRVNEAYLKAHEIYPLQLQTVDYVAGLVRTGLGAAALLGLILFALARPRRTAQAS